MSIQIQQIPVGWRKVGLTDISQIRKGLTYKSADYGSENDGIIFVTLKCIAKGGGFNQEGIKFYKGKYDRSNTVRAGDLIIANTDLTRAGDIIGAPLFMPPVNDDSVLISMDLSAIDIDEDQITKKFLYYYLLQDRVRQFMRNISSGSTVLHLQLKSLKDFQIYLPPLAEQNRIAAIFSRVDEEIKKVERIIEQTEKLKKGLVVALFSNHTNSKKYKINEISEVTSSKRVMVADYVEEGIPFYRSTEIIKKSKNIPVTNPLYISFEKFNAFKDRFGAPREGDLLITAVGTIGDVYLVQEETFYFKDGNLVWIRKLKDFVLPEYLKIILASNFYRDKLNTIAGGSSQKALTIQKLENVEIPIPSISEQKKLTKILYSVDKKILINKKIKSYLLKLKKGLMNDLLSGKVRIIN